ncbi:MAG: hypothetical protein ACP5I4_05460 [Oceanipulchritudo sp.]
MKRTHLLSSMVALGLAAVGLNAAIVVDFVDSSGITNTGTSGDALTWSTSVEGSPLTITASTSDVDFAAWAANTGKDGFGYNTTRGTAWVNGIDGDPDNNTDTLTGEPVTVVGESITFSFSSPVDLGVDGLQLTTNKLGEGLADAATAAGTVVYQYSINGGSVVDGYFAEGDFGSTGFESKVFNLGASQTNVSSITVYAVAGIQGAFRPNTIEIAAVEAGPGPATPPVISVGMSGGSLILSFDTQADLTYSLEVNASGLDPLGWTDPVGFFRIEVNQP